MAGEMGCCGSLVLDRCRLGLLLGVLTLLLLSALKTAAPALFRPGTIGESGVVSIEASAWPCPAELTPADCEALSELSKLEAQRLCAKYQMALVSCLQRNGRQFCENQRSNLHSCVVAVAKPDVSLKSSRTVIPKS